MKKLTMHFVLRADDPDSLHAFAAAVGSMIDDAVKAIGGIELDQVESAYRVDDDATPTAKH